MLNIYILLFEILNIFILSFEISNIFILLFRILNIYVFKYYTKYFINIYRFFDEARKSFPLFQSVTWHCKENVNKLNIEHFEPLKIVEKLPCSTLLHLAGKSMTKETVKKILNRANELNVKNIFALQGGKFYNN